MKISLFVGSLNGGGAERMMVNLANGFCELNHEVILICSNFVGPYCSEVSSKVKIIDLKTKNVFFSIPGLIKTLKNFSPNVLLVTQGHTSLIGFFVTKIFFKNISIIFREATTPSEAKILKRKFKQRIIDVLLLKFYNKADGIVAVSEGVKIDLSNYYNVDKYKIKVINNPVITPELLLSKLVPIDHPFLTKNRSHLALIAVGRVSEVKDYCTMIKALSYVNEFIDAKLIILGKYSENSNEFIKLQNLIGRLHLQDKIDFVGFNNNPFNFMYNSDIFILSSLFEGMPGALIQALACGCQCVSTDCKSGPIEILEDGKLGYLAPVGDFKQLGVGILSLSKNPIDVNLLKNKSDCFNYIESSRGYVNYFNEVIAN